MSEFLSGIESIILQRCDNHPGDTFLKWRDDEIPWRDFVDHIYAVASGLWDAGIRTGDRAAIMMNNCPEFLYTYFAMVFIGIGAVPINVGQRGEALRHILNDSNVHAIVIDDVLVKHYLAIRDLVPSVQLTVTRSTASDIKGDNVALEEWLKVGRGRPPIGSLNKVPADNILYTSGTTGPPKGVVNKGATPDNIFKLWKPLGIHPGETIYNPLPLFHSNALAVSTLGAILLNYKLALGERFSASRHWDECRKYNAVEFNALGAMIPILLKQPDQADDTDNPVREVLSAGCPAFAWQAFEKRFHLQIIEWFGMVDSPGFLMNTTGKVGSMGKPLSGFEFRVVDDEDHDVMTGKVGELVFRSEAGKSASFYYGMEDATNEAWRSGWFHSGDLAWIDEDGDFFYAGRKKASMRRRGENVSAWEIESVVNQHPSVLESAAHAVPSELSEDEIKLVVVLKPGFTTTPQELLDFCQGKMAYYAIPRYIELRNSLPKTGTHRIEYNILKQQGITKDTWDRETEAYTVSRDL